MGSQNNPMFAQMMANPQMLQMAVQMMSNPAMMQAMSGMGAMGGGIPGVPTAAPGASPNPMSANPMGAMMQDPAMMQAMMSMMGGGAGGLPGADGMPEGFGGGMMAPPAASPARCACGNFESGKGDVFATHAGVVGHRH